MQRFRLLRVYVVGIVAVVGLAVWGVSIRRTAAESGTRQASAGGTVAPSTTSTEPSPSGASASQASPTTATTGVVSVTKVSIDKFTARYQEKLIEAVQVARDELHSAEQEVQRAGRARAHSQGRNGGQQVASGLCLAKRHLKQLQRKYRVELLTPQQTLERINRGRRCAEQAGQALTEADLRLVITFAKRYMHLGLPLLDLIQEGRLPVYVADALRKVRQALKERSGREPILKELAKEIGIPPEKLRDLMETTREPVSLETPVSHNEKACLGRLVPDETVPTPDEAVIRTNLQRITNETLKALTPREELVIRLRFGLNPEEEEQTLEEIGHRLGVTRGRIRQLEGRALAKLRHRDLSGKLNPFLR